MALHMWLWSYFSCLEHATIDKHTGRFESDLLNVYGSKRHTFCFAKTAPLCRAAELWTLGAEIRHRQSERAHRTVQSSVVTFWP